MEKLIKTDKYYLKGYARALQDIMFKLTGDNTCGKSYDPIDFCDEKIHSYAFDLKYGGRHHPLKDYKDIDEICDYMLKEAVEWCSTENFKHGIAKPVLCDVVFSKSDGKNGESR